MDHRSELRDLLVACRARRTPESAGVPVAGGVRRVPGLRREEVARLAGISTDYYARLERGRAEGVSPRVLSAVARALGLDAAEREFLEDLASALRTPREGAQEDRAARKAVRPSVQAVLEGLDVPAHLQNHRIEIVAANRLGHALYAGDDPDRILSLPHSLPRQLFLGPDGATLFADWPRAARHQVALLRRSAAHHPDDPLLLQLIGELSTRSPQFRELWAAHDVTSPREGRTTFRHPFAGTLELLGESFLLSDDEDIELRVHTVVPGTRTDEAIRLLASWTAPAPPPRAPQTSHIQS